MTPAEYLSAIAALGLTQSGAGRFFGVTDVTGRRWASVGPPPPVAKFLRLMLRLHFSPAYVDEMVR